MEKNNERPYTRQHIFPAHTDYYMMPFSPTISKEAVHLQ